MKIDGSCCQFLKNICDVIYHIPSQLSQTICEIKNRILLAYHEPSKQIPKLVLPMHPMPNTYPKEYKDRAWPKYLDNAAVSSNPSDIENIAHKVEPLESVTPLHAITTCRNSQRGICQLIADGAAIDAQDIRGQTPAYWAAYKGHLETLTLFKIYGADMNHKDHRGKTPLRAAAKYGHEKIIAFLAAQKVNLNQLDGRGLTPLHVAAFNGRFSAYQTLIYSGADTTIKDPLGRTAEEILKMKYAEIYHNRWFIGRLFSSPIPPSLSLKPWRVENLASAAQKAA